MIVKSYLDQRDWNGLSAWSQNEKGAVRIISSFMLSDDSFIRWRAVEGLGKLSASIAGDNMQQVRLTIQRMLWGMNDESGSIIWSAPEAIAEILVNVPELIDKYGLIMASFIDTEPFPKGVHWGIARVSSVKPELYHGIVDRLLKALQSNDAFIKGCAVIALGNIDLNSLNNQIQGLLNDKAEFELYDMESGEMRCSTVGEVCRIALEKIR